jgi:hypothetical protein
VAAAALLVAGTSAGVTHAADQHSHDINITANFAATIIVDPTALTCGGFDVASQGTAAGSPIGSGGTWRNQESACLLTQLGDYTINGTAVIQATDGGSIDISYHVAASLLDGVVVHPTGTFQVTGGTGEYANATGGGTMAVVVPLLDTAHVSATLAGSIS